MSAGPASSARAADAGRAASRRAALLVHALPAPDRRWLLAQLPLTERERLSGLLSEIRSLGIPSQPDLLRDLLAAATRAASPTFPAAAVPTNATKADADGAARDDGDLESLHRELRALTPPRLAQLLREEPDVLVERIMARLDVEQRHAVQRRLQPRVLALKEPRLPSARVSPPGDGTRLDGALLSALLRRAGAASAAVPAKRSSADWLTRPWLSVPAKGELPARSRQ